jgi:dTDP-glucose 4,6-dehydratase
MIMKQRNILITGGAGFIGSHVVELFTTKYPNYHIVTLDKLTYAGNLANISEALKRENHTFIEGDICDKELVERIFSDYNIDGVLHLAAESHVDRSISAPLVFAHNNVVGTLTLLEAARKAWAGNYDGKRFQHISTDEVYGALELGGGKFTEETRYDPHSPYSASKASSDHFVRAYHDTYGLPTVITNCSNNYGERQYPEKLIPLFIYNIVNRRELPIYGSGENVRDWLYVGDHAKALDMVFHNAQNGATYNIGGDNEWTNIALVHELIGIVDEELGNEKGYSDSLIHHVTDRQGHDLRYAIDSSKLQNELGWRPRTSFAEGLRKTVRWYLANVEWAEKSLRNER